MRRTCKMCGAALTLHEIVWGYCQRCVLRTEDFDGPGLCVESLAHSIWSKEDAVQLSQVGPLLLIWFDHTIPIGILDIANDHGLLLGDIARPLFRSNDLIKYLKSERIWFQGCWIMEDGEIVKHARCKIAWFGAPLESQTIQFVRQFVKSYMSARA